MWCWGKNYIEVFVNALKDQNDSHEKDEFDIAINLYYVEIKLIYSRQGDLKRQNYHKERRTIGWGLGLYSVLYGDDSGGDASG